MIIDIKKYQNLAINKSNSLMHLYTQSPIGLTDLNLLIDKRRNPFSHKLVSKIKRPRKLYYNDDEHERIEERREKEIPISKIVVMSIASLDRLALKLTGNP